MNECVRDSDIVPSNCVAIRRNGVGKASTGLVGQPAMPAFEVVWRRVKLDSKTVLGVYTPDDVRGLPPFHLSICY